MVAGQSNRYGDTHSERSPSRQPRPVESSHALIRDDVGHALGRVRVFAPDGFSTNSTPDKSDRLMGVNHTTANSHTLGLEVRFSEREDARARTATPIRPLTAWPRCEKSGLAAIDDKVDFTRPVIGSQFLE